LSTKRIKALTVEFFGTLFLTFFVIGALVNFDTYGSSANLLLVAATSAIILAVLIVILLPISGALMNPLLVLWAIFRKDLSVTLGMLVIFVQTLGALIGAVLANSLLSNQTMAISVSHTYDVQTYVVAFMLSFGLIFIVASIRKLDFNGNAAFLVPGWLFISILISQGYVFANPAIDLGRMFAASMSTIDPITFSILTLVEVLGAIVAALAAIYIYGYKLKRIRFR
jgi:glycerol uptake facilitator-like aquaporin